MLPIALVATSLTAILTIVVCAFGDASRSSYYIAKAWAKVMCWVSLVKVAINGRENIDTKTSYVFVANHQGAYDIFTIYGYLAENPSIMSLSSDIAAGMLVTKLAFCSTSPLKPYAPST